MYPHKSSTRNCDNLYSHEMHVWNGYDADSCHHRRDWGGGVLLAPSFVIHCETDPERGGGHKQSQKSSDRPIPLNSVAAGHL